MEVFPPYWNWLAIIVIILCFIIEYIGRRSYPLLRWVALVVILLTIALLKIGNSTWHNKHKEACETRGGIWFEHPREVKVLGRLGLHKEGVCLGK